MEVGSSWLQLETKNTTLCFVKGDRRSYCQRLTFRFHFAIILNLIACLFPVLLMFKTGNMSFGDHYNEDLFCTCVLLYSKFKPVSLLPSALLLRAQLIFHSKVPLKSPQKMLFLILSPT